MRMFCNVSIRETNYVFFLFIITVVVYYIFVFSERIMFFFCLLLQLLCITYLCSPL